MGDHNLDVQELLNLYQQAGIQRQPGHREVLGLRMMGGFWGPAIRYNLVSIFVQDDQGQPLQQPRWREEQRPVNPLVHTVIEAEWGALRLAFDDLDLPQGSLRFGPLANGNFIPGDDYSLEFIPPAMPEIVQMQRDELEEILDVVGQILTQVMDLADLQAAQVRGLERMVQDRGNVPAAPSQAPPSSPIGRPMASSSLVQPAPVSAPAAPPADFGWGAGAPPDLDPRLSRVAYNPFLPGPGDGSGGSIPVQPSAPPAILPPLPPAPVQPVIQYVAQPPAQPVIPIQHIRAVTGATPTNLRDIPMWIGRNSAAIEGVFPITTPDIRCRVVNALLGGSLGLAVEPVHCINWATVVATLYVRTHGSYPLHQLADVLRAVVNQEGIATAFTLGSMLTNNNFDLIWGVLRPLLPGQAVVTAMQQRLDQEINDAARIASFVGHLHDVYAILGLNARGQSITRSQGVAQSGSSSSTGRGRGRRNQQRQPVQPQPGQQRRSGQNNQGQSNQNNNQRQSSGGNQGRGGYNLRPNTYRPQRYGGGRGRRWNDNQQQQSGNRSSDQQNSQSQQPQAEARGDQSRTSGAGRGQGGRGNQNRNQRRVDANNTRTVDTVTQATASSTSTGQDGSTSTPATSGGRNQGN